MSTWLDHSSTGVLVLCRRCPSWRRHATDTGHGWSLARDHGRQVHGAKSDVYRHADKNYARRVRGGDSE
jgi:hypothetical protein